MNQGLIPRRYAKALYKVSLDRGDRDELYGLMKKLVDSFSAEPSLRDTTVNPFVSDDDKCRLLMTAAGSDKRDRTYGDFLKLLSQNHRLDLMSAIAREYLGLYRRECGIRKVEVVSAVRLDDDEETRLKRLIESHLDGATMEFSSRVDPSLIGGFTVTVDNERLDASVSNELKQLRLNLLS